MNKYKIILSQTNSQEITIPVEMKWDFLDRNNNFEEYEENVIKEVLNLDNDFETSRFSHLPNEDGLTDINYEFYFSTSNSNVKDAKWSITYQNEGFTPKELYYYANSFKNSFFKLDFYDTPNTTTQTNYFTVILPTQQGLFENVEVGLKKVDVRRPKFKLDFLGDKEGFFLYWLKKRDFLSIDTFFMSAKFFDAKIGVFKKMTNTEQKTITPGPFNFKGEDFFYYKLKLDYGNYTYQVFNTTNNRVGTDAKPIKWYEYINPE